MKHRQLREKRMRNTDKTRWIWNRHWSPEDKNEPGVMLFRKEITILEGLANCRVKVSADTKYKLYINGHLAEIGPSRGDREIWFYETVDLTKYLMTGKNCIAAVVLRYPEDPGKGNHGMFRTATPGLFIDGRIIYENGASEKLRTDETWKCLKDSRIVFIREEERFAPLIIHEEVYGNPAYRAWKMPGYQDDFWEDAFCYAYTEVPEAVSPGNLHPRDIPSLYLEKRQFRSVKSARVSVHSKEEWEDCLKGGHPLRIPPHTREIVEIDAGEEMTGFIHAAFEKGMNAKVRILYAEAYVMNGFEGPERIPVKNDREDCMNGHLSGYSDLYHLYGQGDEQRAEHYFPFWFRTFRFIQLTIETAEEPLLFDAFDYKETGYPLQVKTAVHTSDLSMNPIWEISERTLRRCMHETYEDCPYYEQLQYLMDTRQQILYTYAVSADDRLARKCIADMRRSQRYDGLLNASYPNMSSNVIPGFSIYYILMVYDHMMYFGDKELVRESLPVIEGILNFFRRNLDENGLVRKTGGLLDKARFWSFIDWAREWNDTNGMPPAGLYGPLTMESLLYILGLQKAAELMRWIGRHDEAAAALQQSQLVQAAVLAYCRGSNGMLTDGPGIEQYSQHCQVFAVLTGTGEKAVLRRNLLKSMQEPGYTRCTVAMRFYLFRALEKLDLYQLTEEYWEPWRIMIKNHCTTCVESEAYARSECHGWGALALFELPTVTLGVSPAEPGYETIRIHPTAGYMTEAKGDVMTPKGMVHVEWVLKDGKPEVQYRVPEGVKIKTSVRPV